MRFGDAQTCLAFGSLSSTPEAVDTLIYTLKSDKRERQVEVPRDFWQQNRADLEKYFAETYPGIDWASNGAADPMWAINLYF